jgi:hypothetical protein
MLPAKFSQLAERLSRYIDGDRTCGERIPGQQLRNAVDRMIGNTTIGNHPKPAN